MEHRGSGLGGGPSDTPMNRALGRFHKQQGNGGEARKSLADALAIFDRLATLIEPDKVRKELADLTQ